VKESLDFVVVGAQKSGTTTIFEHLRPHPELHLPPGKEAPFFSDDERWSDGWGVYVRRYFGGAKDDTLWGTVTPQYMYGTLSRGTANGMPTERIVPERIAKHSPAARLVAILRDPVERAFSHFRMEAMRGAEQRSFAEAIDELLDPEQLRRSRRVFEETTAYVTNGEFGRILEPYFELFGAEQVHVCFSNDLAERPAETVAAIVRFIGADEGFEPPNLGERFRVGGSHRRVRGLDLYRVQERIAASRPIRAAWRAMPRRLRTRVDETFKEAAYQVDVRNRVTTEATDAPSLETTARLREHFAADREKLRALIGAEPPW
jgi:hypothetical protein